MSAKALLNNRDIEYKEVNIDKDSEARDWLIAAGHRTMPQIYENNELFVEGGFQGLKEHFDKQDLNTADLGTL